MSQEMPDGVSPEIGESNATPRVEDRVAVLKEPDNRLKTPGYRHGPKLSIDTGIKRVVAEGFLVLTAACGIGQAKTPTHPISPTPEGLGGTPTQTWTPTEAATATETQTPTEIPLFTEAEVEAASAFDVYTWPEWLRNIQLHPELTTEQQWQDEFQFVLAVREKDGISRTSNFNGNSLLQSFHNGLDWEQAHPDEVRAGKKVAIAPVEYRAMIKESKNIKGLHPTTASAVQTYKSEIIGPILGRNDIDSERRAFDTISGKLAGFGTIGGENVLLIDVEDNNGHHVLFPVVVYIGEGPTLLEGSTCLVVDLNYSDRHGGNPTFTLLKDIELGPLIESGTGKVITWEDLYAALGEDVDISGGGYMPELSRKTGIPETHGFSPGLNLEVASWIRFPPPKK